MGKWRLLSKEEQRAKNEYSAIFATDNWLNYECSVCGHTIHNSLRNFDEHRTPYCPMCGDKKESNEI